jgi:hypothetical protein
MRGVVSAKRKYKREVNLHDIMIVWMYMWWEKKTNLDEKLEHHIMDL